MMTLRARVLLCIGFLLFSSPTLAQPASLAACGSVRTADGPAPTRVLAELVPVLSHLESSRLILGGRHLASAIASAAPDPDTGRFCLQAPKIGLYRVRISAPGHMPMRSLPLAVTETLELPPLSLAVASSLKAVVRDAQGRPIGDAWITARTGDTGRELWREQGSPGWFTTPRFARSGADGRASLPRLPGESLNVEVHPPHHAEPLVFADIDARLDVRLEAGEVPRREIVLAGADAGVVVSIGNARWPVGELDAQGRLSFAARLEDPLGVHFLSAESPLHSVWLEAEAESMVYESLPVRSFSGRLVDPDGQPLAGALVWPGWDPGAQAITDERGIYTFLRPLSPGFEVRGAAPDLAPGRLRLSHAAAGQGTVPDLVLRAAGTADGRVLDGAGRGIAHARVMASAITGAARPDLAPIYTATDGDGRFELRGLAPDVDHQLTAHRDGYFPAVRDVGGIRPGGRRADLAFVLTARHGAFGRVVDLDERPLAGIDVLVRPTDSTAEAENAVTAADGSFEIATLPAPKVDLIASGDGYAPLTVPGVEPGLGDGWVDLGTLILEPGVTLAGVVTAAGEPLDGVQLWLSELPVTVERLAWESQSQEPPAAVSDTRGRFALDGLAPDQRIDLIAYRDGYLPTALRRVEAPTETPVQIELQPAARIAGWVLNEDLEPIADAAIHLGADELPAGVSPIPDPVEHDPERKTRSGPDGFFEIALVPSGNVVLEVLAPGFQPAAERRFELRDGEHIDDLEIVLKHGATLAGLVTSADGDPVKDAFVVVGRSMGVTRSDGTFQVEGIAPGRHTADAWHPHFDRLEQDVKIEPGVNHQDFVFDSAHRLGGRVVDERGAALSDVAVELTLSDRPSYVQPRTLTDGLGRFDFPSLAEGIYRLRVEKSGWVADAPWHSVELIDADIDDLEIVLLPSVRLTGEILGLDFERLAGVRVEAATDDGRRRQGEVAYDGIYQVEDLAPGDWLVSAAAAEGKNRVETRIVIASGEDEVYRDLEFEEGLNLSGRVEHDGEPVGAVQIALRGTDVAVVRDVQADHDGSFRFEDLEAGSYRLSVSSRWELFIHNQDVLLESDRDLLIELDSAELTGRVITEAGGGVHDAIVLLQQLMSADGSEGSLFTVGTDAEGAFRFERLPAGRFLARIRKDGYAQLEEELDIVTGASDASRTFVLEPTEGIELQLRLASGSVPAAAQITLLDASGQPVQTEARSLFGGTARFETLRPGDWRALVVAPGGAAREIALTIPGEPIEIVLADAGRLRVRVPDLFDTPQRATLILEDASGRPLVALDPRGMPRPVWPVDRGTTTLEGVPAGQWTLRLTSPDGQERIGAVATPGHTEVEVVMD